MSLFADESHAADDARLRGRRVGWLLLALTLFGVFGLAVLPSPYVIERPGPVIDTLGTVTIDGEDVPLIQIPSEPTYETPAESHDRERLWHSRPAAVVVRGHAGLARPGAVGRAARRCLSCRRQHRGST